MGTRCRTAAPWLGSVAPILLATMLVGLTASACVQHSPLPARSRTVDRSPLLALQQEAGTALAKGEPGRAGEALRKALDLVPGDPGATFNLAQAYVRTGEKQKALDLLSQLAERNLGFHPDSDPEFQTLALLPGYRTLLQTIDRLEPRVVRSHAAFVIHESDLFPEGIACDARSGALYVSSILKRKIVRISRDGQVTDFTNEHQDGLFGVLGLRVDEARGELWAAASGGPEQPEDENRSGLWAFDLATGKLVGKHLLPAGTPHLLNDLVVDAAGFVYATDTTTGAIYRAGGVEGTIEPFAVPGTFRSPNGIALSSGGQSLYVASAGRGISMISIATREVSDLRAPADVVTLGIDGLYSYGHDLIAVQNAIGRPRLVRYVLTSPDEIDRVEILESRHPLYDTPTTAAICKGRVYYVANPHLDHAAANGALTPGASLADLVVLELPL